uniref:hypothetical protein n=1 Tax=Streptomyces natalensis TaxID=68242 RepID=UPI0018663912|nr:hypothetical protein [Streptomyces natalensis]
MTVALVVVAVGCLAFTATNVTQFALDHGVSRWIAWLLDPLVASALGTVLVVDGLLSEFEVRPGGMASLLRWFAGLATWLMNCWGSLWPTGTPFGIPTHLDPAGLLLHSVLPVLLVLLAEAITTYRRRIVSRIAVLDEADTGWTPVDTPMPAPASAPVRPSEPILTASPAPAAPPAPVRPQRRLEVICGAEQVFRPALPARPVPSPKPEPEPAPVPPNGADDPHVAIVRAWWDGELSTRQTAERVGLSKTTVANIWRELAAEHGQRPAPGQPLPGAGQTVLQGVAA